MMRSRCLASLALVASLAACGGSATTTKTAKVPAAPSAPSAAPVEKPAPLAPVDDHSLRRSAVRSVVKGGLGLFLQKVALEDQPVMREGRFRGFRIAALRDPDFWNGVDLSPGDVVIRVNGLSIEHPEEALEAFHSLESATELRVAYERDGEMRELTYGIVDDEPQKRADASAP